MIDFTCSGSVPGLMPGIAARAEPTTLRIHLICLLGAGTRQPGAALKDPNSEVKRTAAHALGDLEHESAMPELMTLLDDWNSTVCVAAVQALAAFGASALPHLRQAAQSRDVDAQIEALCILGRMRDVEALPLLFDAANDSNPDLRVNAVESLGLLRDARAKQILQPLLRDQDHGTLRRFWDGQMQSSSISTFLVNQVVARALYRLGTSNAQLAIKEAVRAGVLDDRWQMFTGVL